MQALMGEPNCQEDRLKSRLSGVMEVDNEIQDMERQCSFKRFPPPLREYELEVRVLFNINQH